MAYDEDLAERIRDLVADEPDVTEKKMFGGLAFLLGGHMAVTASRVGGIMVRVEPGQSVRLLATTPATRVEMRGSELADWLRIDAEHLRTKRQLAPWVRRGVAAAKALPPRTARRR